MSDQARRIGDIHLKAFTWDDFGGGKLKVEKKEKKTPEVLGKKEMKDILDRYSDEELCLLCDELGSLQINQGCNSGCNFCGLKVPRGVRMYFNKESIDYLLSRRLSGLSSETIGGKLSDFTKDGISLGFADELFDNPDFLEIFDLVKGAKKFANTSYPNIPNIGEVLWNFLNKIRRIRGQIRISVRKENYKRLIRDGWLEVIAEEDEDGEYNVLVPTRRARECMYGKDKTLNFSYRFVRPKIDGMIIRDWDTNKGDGISKGGRFENGGGGRDSSVAKSKVFLSPVGFRNYFSIDNQHLGKGDRFLRKIVMDFPDMDNMDGFESEIQKNFSEQKPGLVDLVNTGELAGMGIREVLRLGVLGDSQGAVGAAEENKGFFILKTVVKEGGVAKIVEVKITYHVDEEAKKVVVVGGEVINR